AASGEVFQPGQQLPGDRRCQGAVALVLVVLVPLALDGLADPPGRGTVPARQPGAGPVGELLQPEVPAVPGGERGAFGGDEVAGGGAQRLHGGRVVGAVEGVDLGQGGGEAPAVEDGVVLGDRPVEGVVVEDVHGHAAQRSGRQVEGVAMLASYVLRQRRLLIVGAAQVG